MTPRTGLAVTESDVRVVVVDRGRIVFTDMEPRREQEEIADPIPRLLARVVHRGATRTPVGVALGLTLSHVARIHALPKVTKRGATQLLVQENADRFFATPFRARTTPLLPSSDETMWGAALDRDVVDQIIVAVNASGRRVQQLSPVAAILHHAFADSSFHWIEGATRIDVTRSPGTFSCIRRYGAPDETVASQLAPALAALSGAGEAAAPYASAFGAAVAERHALSVKPAPSDDARLRNHRLRLATATGALILSAAAALIAPALRFSTERRSAEGELGRMESTATAIAATRADLQRETSTLDQMVGFAANRRSMASLLGAVALALPDSSAMTSIRVDSLGASFTALAPRVAEVIPALANVAGVENVRLTGTITREMLGATQLERATIHFQFPRAAKPKAGTGRSPTQ